MLIRSFIYFKLQVAIKTTSMKNKFPHILQAKYFGVTRHTWLVGSPVKQG